MRKLYLSEFKVFKFMCQPNRFITPSLLKMQLVIKVFNYYKNLFLNFQSANINNNFFYKSINSFIIY